MYPNRRLRDVLDYPARINGEYFTLGHLDSDILTANFQRGFHLRPPTRTNIDSSGLSEVQNEDSFKVMLNVKHFKPNEISIKTIDNSVVIHGKHDEKIDEHGFVSREFTRRYLLPEDVEPNTVASKLASDGVLTIEAPKKKPIEAENSQVRVVPITLETPAVAGQVLPEKL